MTELLFKKVVGRVDEAAAIRKGGEVCREGQVSTGVRELFISMRRFRRGASIRSM